MTTSHHPPHTSSSRSGRRTRARRPWPVCPTCHTAPRDDAEAARLRDELRTSWWSTTDPAPDTGHGRLIVTRHCGHCQPHQVYAIACLFCGDGPLLTGPLAAAVHATDPHQLPQLVTDQLTADGWQWRTAGLQAGWTCC